MKTIMKRIAALVLIAAMAVMAPRVQEASQRATRVQTQCLAL